MINDPYSSRLRPPLDDDQLRDIWARNRSPEVPALLWEVSACRILFGAPGSSRRFPSQGLPWRLEPRYGSSVSSGGARQRAVSAGRPAIDAGTCGRATARSQHPEAERIRADREVDDGAWLYRPMTKGALRRPPRRRPVTIQGLHPSHLQRAGWGVSMALKCAPPLAEGPTLLRGGH